MRRIRGLVALLLALPLFAASALAVDPDYPLARLQERQWGREDGLPSDIQFMARTSDGFLWLVAARGLFVFDGVSFTEFVARDGHRPRLDRVLAMRADASGGLWIAYRRGGATHVRDGEMRHWPDHEGSLKGMRLVDFAFDGEGRVHAAATAGVVRLEGDEWRRLPLQGDGADDGSIDNVAFDGEGGLWARGDSGLWRRPAGSERFERVQAAAGSPTSGLIASPGGDIYTWDFDGTRNLCRVHPVDRAGCWTLDYLVWPTFDAEGALWWGTHLEVNRVSHPDRLALDDPSAAEASRQYRSLHSRLLAAADADTLWVSGGQTLTRLRTTPVRQTRLPTGALAAGDAGRLWLASFNRGLMQIGPAPAGAELWSGDDGTLWTAEAVAQSATIADAMVFEPGTGTDIAEDEPVVLQRYPAAGRTAMRLDRGRDGDLLLANRQPSPTLMRVRPDDGKVTPVPLPPLYRKAFVTGMATDRSGDLWFGGNLNHDVGFYRFKGGAWQADAGKPGFARGVVGFALDGQDRPWVFASNGLVSVLTDGRWQRFGIEQGLDIGAGMGLHDAQGQIWLLGRDGVAGYTGLGFVTLRGRGGLGFPSVTGIRHRADGELWFYGADGIVRIRADEWRKALADPAHEVAYTLLDHLDGVSVTAMQGSPLPSVAETSDGRLWFAGTSELFWIDPSEVAAPWPAPPVVLRSLEVDGVTRPVHAGARLPEGTRRLALAFAAPLAELPEHTRFRYRLVAEGEAKPRWLSSGEGREVVYHRLPPGDYRFEIVASDREGRWGSSPTVLAFAIEPAFHQTRTFIGLLVFAGLLLLSAFYLLRLRQLSARLRAEMDARLAERERIARDLHDTLLQGVQALLLTFQAIANRLPDDNAERVRMESALDRAQEVVREGRDRVGALREPATERCDLVDCLQRQAQALSADYGIPCEVIAASPRALDGQVHEQCLQVGGEALANAFRHAHARQVRVGLDYGRDALVLTVRDDGIGLPEDCLRGEGREGHWGLAGMRERARSIGATLSLRKPDGGGTEVRFTVPAATAYPPPAPGRWRRWFGRH